MDRSAPANGVEWWREPEMWVDDDDEIPCVINRPTEIKALRRLRRRSHGKPRRAELRTEVFSLALEVLDEMKEQPPTRSKQSRSPSGD